MIAPDHECSWIRRRSTQLTVSGGALSGFGVTRAVLERAALARDATFSISPLSGTADTLAVRVGEDRGTLHDQCMISFAAVSTGLRSAIVNAAMELHEAYLGGHSAPVAAVNHIESCLASDCTIVIASYPSPASVSVRAYPVTSSWLRRQFGAATTFRCE